MPVVQDKSQEINSIRMLIIEAMYSDDYLMENLVLKGGNALDLIYKLSYRSSIDLDFSISKDFEKDNLQLIEKKIEQTLTETFDANGYRLIDFKFIQKPTPREDDPMEFWGGYVIEFKVSRKDKLSPAGSIKEARNKSLALGKDGKKACVIEISKFEYCTTKVSQDFQGLTIYVYSPAMILLEKLRALCQQTDQYMEIIQRKHTKARAKDFYDIYVIHKEFEIDVSSEENIEILKGIFSCKHVPVELLMEIKNSKEQHRPDFSSVESTVRNKRSLKEFDYYFDYTISLIDQILKALGVV